MSTPAPNRNPGQALTSTTEGSLAGYPQEFTASTETTETSQTGQALNVPLTPPDGSAILEASLLQDKTDERTLKTRTANFDNLHLVQQETDPTAGTGDQINKSIVPSIGGVYIVAVSNGGSGYSEATIVTGTTPTNGLPALYKAVLLGGVLTSITILDPGSNHIIDDVLTITDSGGGSGCAAVGKIPAYLSVDIGITRFTGIVGGTGYTHISVTAPAPSGGTAPVLIGNLTGGALTSITIVSGGLGAYASAPTITITGDGSLASATAAIGPTNFYDITPINKWASILFKSAGSQTQAQLDSLAVTITDTAPLPFPTPTLQSVVVYRDAGSHTETASGTFNNVTVGGGYTYSGGVGISVKQGPTSEALRHTAITYWKGPPPVTETITKVQLSEGMVVVQGGAFSVFDTYTVNDSVSGQSEDVSVSFQYQVVSVPPVLTNSIGLTYSGGGQATGTLHIDASTPTHFTTGDTIIASVKVQPLRFNEYKKIVESYIYP